MDGLSAPIACVSSWVTGVQNPPFGLLGSYGRKRAEMERPSARLDDERFASVGLWDLPQIVPSGESVKTRYFLLAFVRPARLTSSWMLVKARLDESLANV